MFAADYTHLLVGDGRLHTVAFVRHTLTEPPSPFDSNGPAPISLQHLLCFPLLCISSASFGSTPPGISCMLTTLYSAHKSTLNRQYIANTTSSTAASIPIDVFATCDQFSYERAVEWCTGSACTLHNCWRWTGRR